MYDYSFLLMVSLTTQPLSVWLMLSPIISSEMKKRKAAAACITDLLFSAATSEQCWMWSGIPRILH